MIELTMSELEKIAYNNHYLPYDFFIELDPLEIDDQKGLVYHVEETGQYFKEMQGGVKMLVVDLSNVFYLLILIFAVFGMCYGFTLQFPSIKNSKFFQSFFK